MLSDLAVETHNLGMALWRFSGGNVSTKIRHRLTSSTACLWYALPMFLMYLASERASKRSSKVIGIPIGRRGEFRVRGACSWVSEVENEANM